MPAPLHGSALINADVSQHMNNIHLRYFTSILLAGLSVGVVSPQCIAQKSTPEHSIKEDDPPIGSRIRRDEVSWTALPVNVTYQQLTPQERA